LINSIFTITQKKKKKRVGKLKYTEKIEKKTKFTMKNYYYNNEGHGDGGEWEMGRIFLNENVPKSKSFTFVSVWIT
jgi:hypothetical protein